MRDNHAEIDEIVCQRKHLLVLNDAGDRWHDTVPLIDGGPRALELIDEAVAISREHSLARHKLSEVRLLAPLIPGLILASGGNCKDHRDEKDEAPLAGREPEYFFKTPRSVIGPDDLIELGVRLIVKPSYVRPPREPDPRLVGLLAKAK